MKYKYTAMNSKNQKKEGTVDASSQTEAIATLRSKGLIVQDIVETGEATESIWDMDIGGDIHTRKIKPKKLLMFFNQMGMMMKAGINLSMSMDIMIQTEKDSGMKKILQEINENLYSGFTLSQAMRNFAGFPGVYLSIIEAGEANGRIDSAFEQSLYLRAENKTSVIFAVKKRLDPDLVAAEEHAPVIRAKHRESKNTIELLGRTLLVFDIGFQHDLGITVPAEVEPARLELLAQGGSVVYLAVIHDNIRHALVIDRHRLLAVFAVDNRKSAVYQRGVAVYVEPVFVRTSALQGLGHRIERLCPFSHFRFPFYPTCYSAHKITSYNSLL